MKSSYLDFNVMTGTRLTPKLFVSERVIKCLVLFLHVWCTLPIIAYCVVARLFALKLLVTLLVPVTFSDMYGAPTQLL